MSGKPTKCDLVRAAVAAQLGGECGATPSPDCAFLRLASERDAYAQAKYAPAGIFTADGREVRARSLQILQKEISADVEVIKQRHGADAPVDLTWNDFTRCLWSPDGASGGPHRNTHIEREDLVSLGYSPRPAFGGGALSGKLPAALTAQAPVWGDRLLNPDLMMFALVFAALVLLGWLVWRAYRAQNPPQPDVTGHSTVESFLRGPGGRTEKLRALVPVYEHAGHCMKKERAALGMSPVECS